nr:RES domain-containing protein [uncultured Roseateles sp.]
MRVPPIPAFKGWQLDTELIDAGSIDLLRGFSRPGAEWEPPPSEFRNGRIDPPPGHKSEYAVLYTATEIQCVAAEMRVLENVRRDHVWSVDKSKEVRVATFAVGRASLFIPLDGLNRTIFGVRGECDSDYHAYQWLGLQLFRRYGHLANGLSWESFHGEQPGRCYAIWHSRKASMELATGRDFPTLHDHPRWRAFLAACPFIRPNDTDAAAKDERTSNAEAIN